ncbi:MULTISPECIES: histidine phosphatase family protein [Mycolicibacterium]|uniref:Phosphoglycerate mutase n=1 Tax=Mycolicibacterium senegalense TaxID=1796 RepID=A0A378W8S0_9MYCO|nr:MULTISPECIES: histidine phosphatase family protein [Mycolicibacterium]MCV7337555.1 histidine phosphatase family protein [Mycolicibacterium senegalense]MDR7287246.1 putative phosphoglycerate mutase [Mycolicibacterium senegalense]QZA24336.1 histidine phosphatase family protein [Mycolicibacterium senegalense]CDP87734.1 phosphoglycerate mutase [Mycolicibacterium farcinogenes]SUA29179.1 phosphoglycerate mutase [Mycolicibacterium senegalense]
MSGRLILVRHGQSHGNVARRLDTLPPGAELTDLGHEQARRFAGTLGQRPSILAHSVARRAAQTAAGIGAETGLVPFEFDGVHEVQVGELEDRSDDDAVAEFNRIYARWHRGELDVPMPGGESAEAVLARYVPVLTELRLRYLDDHDFKSDIVLVSHGAAIRLVAAVLAGVDGTFALDHHLANTESIVLAPITDGRWSCVQWASVTPPFYPESGATPVADAVTSETDPMG